MTVRAREKNIEKWLSILISACPFLFFPKGRKVAYIYFWSGRRPVPLDSIYYGKWLLFNPPLYFNTSSQGRKTWREKFTKLFTSGGSNSISLPTFPWTKSWFFFFRSRLRAWQCRLTFYKMAAVTSFRWVFQKSEKIPIANRCPTSNPEWC